MSTANRAMAMTDCRVIVEEKRWSSTSWEWVSARRAMRMNCRREKMANSRMRETKKTKVSSGEKLVCSEG